MFRKINRVLRTAILLTGAGVLLVKLAEKEPKEQIAEENHDEHHREKDTFQEKEFDDIW